jgi:RND family efflux transporter MFP subunit
MARKIVTTENSSNRFNALRSRVVSSSKKSYNKASAFVKSRPFASLLIAFGLLLVVLVAGKVFGQPPAEQAKTPAAKSVSVYGIGSAPKATFQAKIEKSGVVKVMAQSAGIVQYISAKEGEQVGQGQQLVSLSSNYQGGNASSVQRQIAQTQYQNAEDTFGLQTDLIQKQRDVATTSAENEGKLREVSRNSLGDTNAQIDRTQDMIDQMNSQLPNMPADEQGELQAQISQAQSGLDQLRAAQRTADYTSSNDNPPAKLANLQKDISLKQLDVQEKAQSLSKEVSRLQLSLAYVNEATMYPASPFAGTVERIYVKQGEQVSPGTVLASVTSSEVKATAILNVPENVATLLASGEPSELIIGKKKVAITPYHVSTQATDGQMYSVLYDIPEDYQKALSDGEYVSISVPVSKPKTTSTDPFIPIDAVYQSQESAFVLVVNNGKAETRKVKLGKVFGSFVEILSGIRSGDQVIIDRNVVAGDKITVH